MTTRMAKWLAGSLWALYVALSIPGTLLDALNNPSGVSANPAGFIANAIFEDALVGLVMMTVGALVASRRKENPIGWLFCAGALLGAAGGLGIGYAVYALKTAPGTLPAGVWVGLFGEWARSIGWYLLLTFLLLLFPTGRVLTRRWRPVAWWTAACLAFNSLTSILVPDAFANASSRLADVPNPMPLSQQTALMSPLEGLSILLMFASTIVCGVSLVVRFQRARGLERQQLKWFVYAVVCGLVTFTLIIVTMFLPSQPSGVSYGFDLILVALPLATGIAILQHKLFDIDLIIRRTLIYGSLTAILGALYFAVVLGAQLLSQRLMGQSDVAPWLIVVTTLLIAALFMPMRRRVQRAIDHRFYRRRYDAARTVEAFAATLRTNLDLNELGQRLVNVVEETMQPATVSLWMRHAPGSDERRA